MKPVKINKALARKGKRKLRAYEHHGHVLNSRERTPTYRCWMNMVQRCTNKNRPDYKYYGARGITICDEWKVSFLAFLTEMGEKPAHMQLERIENNAGYCKANCKWATKGEQMQNTRGTRLIAFDDKVMGLNAWARKLGISHSTLQGRLKRGWSTEKALSTPNTKGTGI